MEQVEADFKLLPKDEQLGLLEKLQDEIEDELEFTPEFAAEIVQAKQDLDAGKGRVVTPN